MPGYPCCCRPASPTVVCGFCSGNVAPASFALTVPRYQYLRMTGPNGAVQSELLVFPAGTYILDQYIYRSQETVGTANYLPGCIWFGPLISIPGSPADTGISFPWQCRRRWFFQLIPNAVYVSGPRVRIGVASLQTGAINDFYVQIDPIVWEAGGLATTNCQALNLSVTTPGIGLSGGAWDGKGTYPAPPHCGMTENPIWIRNQIFAGDIHLVAL